LGTTASKHGVAFEYGPVRRGPDGAIAVTVGYMADPGWGAVWECQVSRVGGDWQVDRCPVVEEI
jgi:hypothetical protein